MKGVDVGQFPNFIRLILATNNDWVVPASAEQRRFVVIDASAARMQDTGILWRNHSSNGEWWSRGVNASPAVLGSGGCKPSKDPSNRCSGRPEAAKLRQCG